ncbi:4-amino-4-deoxy-L-arabinose transferase [Schaalia odontolytica]|uniref:Polyprenol-phosphate-mannose--protein mannosyltransferase n=1 Tax=Schaalia odontolytica TaxID=1660 RepID=A0A2X0TZJ1_9ACTO|nr:glycosyltransferase family 39 protein [Schaalia odontolytica]SPT54466.1 4-amino-4-deoxy-L-arabinose transferase [Schaalia odontolytica]
MDTATAHCDTINEATDTLEQGTATVTSAEEGAKTSPPPPAAGWTRRLNTPAAGWVATLIATIIAAAIRLPGLDNVRTLIFDETYYVKDAWSLLTFGYEGTWAKDVDTAFASGDTSGLSAVGGYPVHPPTGKWLIALGMKLFGQADPVGWRIAAAICGIITVILLCRLAQNLFHTPALTLLAGLFLATDGMAIVMSRTSILDGFLTMFALAAFLCVVKDQQVSRPRLEAKLSEWEGLGTPRRGWDDAREYFARREHRPYAIGPNAGNRPWLFAAGLCAGLACSVKWSGIYALAFLGLFVALREVTCRWKAGHPAPIRGALLADIWWAFSLMVPTAILTYIASWFGWFAHPSAHGHGRSGIRGFAGSLADLWLYHKEMWAFHNNLSTPHTYQSSPYTWLAQYRATSFHWANGAEITGCASEKCVTDIVALGNPLLWWIGIGALALVLWTTLRYFNWRTGVIALGYIALYAPWLAYAHRTIFTFYTVVFAPFVALAVAWMIGLVAGWVSADGCPLAAPSPDAPS